MATTSTRNSVFTYHGTGYDPLIPIYYPRVVGGKVSFKKAPLTPKQKKARAKAKRAKQARKVNHRYLTLNKWQLKKLNKKKRNEQKKRNTQAKNR